jgi:hypothetical protein
MKTRKRKKYSVQASVNNLELTRAGSAINLVIESHGETLGTLHIGRGSLFWWGARKKTRKRIAWSKLADMFDQ